MATRTTNNRIQLNGSLSFQRVSKLISSLSEKMKNDFSESEESISQTLSKVKENQSSKLDSGFMTQAYLYSGRI